MKKVRIIPRLDIKGPNVVKGMQLEGVRVVGAPAELARKYYSQGADELIYMDVVASLYNRNNLIHIVEETTEKDVFIPITVGGGIRTLEDISQLLHCGADKVAVNTAAVKNPHLLEEAVKVFGSSTIVLSIEAKKMSDGKWQAYTDNGREKTGLDVIEWVKQAAHLGVGEILITSVDKEGMRSGYDLDLINAVTSVVSVPVVVSGGAGCVQHIAECMANKKVDGIAVASLLHYGEWKVNELKEKLSEQYKERIKYNYQHEVKIKGKAGIDVSIVNYDLGNLRSVKNTFRQLGACPRIINTPEEILNSDYLVLPGVGSFGQAMENLKKKNLDKAIIDYADSGKPLLGICLGMQLLMSKSYEFGEHRGLGLIEGEVLPFTEAKDLVEEGYKIPHVGWNSIYNFQKYGESILSKVPDNASAYFIHSFYVKPRHNEHILALTNYFGYEFCSVVRKGNIFGCQFHPEKSGKMGLSILEEFIKIEKREEVNVQ